MFHHEFRSYPRAGFVKRVAGSVGALVLGAIVLGGCSEGSSSTPDGIAGSSPDLSGTMYLYLTAASALSGEIYAMDPATGEVRQHLAERPEGRQGGADDGVGYASLRSFDVRGSGADGSLLLTVVDCLDPPERELCIERVAPDGSVERLFTLTDSLEEPAVLSPDGSLIAVLVSPRFDFTPYELLLLTSSGDLVDSRVLSEVAAPRSRFDFTPDNRLVYSYLDERLGSLLVVGSPGSLAEAEVYRVSDGSYYVGAISANPNGESIAYELRDVEGNARVSTWVVDRADGVARRVVDASVELGVFGPEWSPDGDTLLVSMGVGDGDGNEASAPGISTNPFQMVIEWTGESVLINPFEGTGRQLAADDRVVTGFPTDQEFWIFDTPIWVR